MWTHTAPTLLLTITVLTKTSLTLKAACGLGRFVQLTSREEPVIWENQWEGKEKKILPRTKSIQYSDRKNI